MSQLTDNTTIIDECIDLAKSIPETLPVETCTVTFEHTDTNGNPAASGFFTYTAYENGQVVSKIVCGDVPNYSVNNVVKNSLLVYYRRVATISPQGSVCLAGNATATSGQQDPDVPVYFVTGDCKLISYTPCLARDTRILLADRTTKLVQDISYDDHLLVWNFDEGCYSSAKPSWIKVPQVTTSYYRCELSDGTVLKLIGSGGKCHRLFDIEKGSFESATDCVGKLVATVSGEAVLEKCEKVEEEIEFYNIITDTHINLFAENVLTSCRLNNLYPVEDMKFVKGSRELIPLDAYRGISEEFYYSLRLAERKPEDIDFVSMYIENLYRLMK